MEHRQFSRRACRIDAEVRLRGESSSLSARITDISVGGCYIEMLAPLPVDSPIEVFFKPGEVKMSARGKVSTSQLGLGMGVSFLEMAPEDFQELLRYCPPSRYASSLGATGIPGSGAAAGSASELLPSNGGAPTTAEELEAVVRILTRKGLLGRSEIVEEMDRLKEEKANPPVSPYSSVS